MEEETFIETRILDCPNKKDLKRNGAVESFMDEINDNGCLQTPLIVDRRMKLITGHTRLMAAKRMGLKHVWVRIVGDLTPEQIKEYRKSENKYCDKQLREGFY